MQKLLIVESAHSGHGRGLTLMPRITVHEAPRAQLKVRLRRPDGSERDATATMQVAHIRGPNGAFAMVRVLDATEADVPAGTEVWRVDDE